MAKRIYLSAVKKYAIAIGATAIPIALLLFWYLSSLGAITITGFSGDQICAGTIENPCIAYINMTAKEDIFVYPDKNWSGGFYTNGSVKSTKMYRSWGNGWREINLTTNCKGTWCGAPDSSGNTAYSFAFRHDIKYNLKFEVLKSNVNESIKWGFAEVDPIFYGVNNQYKEYSELDATFSIKDKTLNTLLFLGKRISPANKMVGAGYQQVAEFEVNSSVDLINFIKKIELYDLKDNSKPINRTLEFKYQDYENRTVYDYQTICEKIIVNGTEAKECTQKVVGNHTIKVEVWKDFDGNVKAGKKVILGFFTDVMIGESVEWIPTFYGDFRISEWSTWTASLSVDLVDYYNFEDQSGATLKDVVVGYSDLNGTITGSPTNVSGRIGSGLNFSAAGQYVSFYKNITNGSSQGTICIWGKTPTVTDDLEWVWGQYTGGSNSYIAFANGTTSANWGRFHLEGTNLLSNTSYKTVDWHLSCSSWGSLGAKLWFDNGTLVASNVMTTKPNMIGGFLIGARNTAEAHRNYIALDEIGAWTRQITQAEVQQVWNNGAGITYPGVVVLSTAPIVYLNYPKNNQNISTRVINFSVTFVDSDNSTLPVSLYGNWTGSWRINATNSSALNNTQTNFTNIPVPDGKYIYNALVNDGITAVFNATNFTFIRDTTPPVSTFLNKIPNDLNQSSVQNSIINYSMIENLTAVNASSSRLYYKTNSTTHSYWQIVNGTVYLTNYTSVNMTNQTTTFSGTVEDHDIFPGVFNYNESQMHSYNKGGVLLTASTQYLSIEFLNFSSTEVHNFIMINATRTSGTMGLLVYYCNSSYSFTSTPATNSFCTQFATWNNDGIDYENIPFFVNQSTGLLNTINTTSKSYFIFRGALGTTTWNISYISNMSRTGAIRLSTNNGASFVNQTYTVDAHLHQFQDTDTFFYFACSNNTLGLTGCSTVQNDTLQTGNTPPTTPIITHPQNATYNQSVPLVINWTKSISFNGYEITYNVSILNVDLSFNSTVNSSLSQLTVNYTSPYFGNFRVQVNATDSNGLASWDISDVFTVVDIIYPQVDFVSPTEANNTKWDRNWIYVNVSVTETNPKNITFRIYNDTGIWNSTTYTINTGTQNKTINWTGLAYGDYRFNVSATDLYNNINTSEVRYQRLIATSFRIFFNNIEGNNTAEIGDLNVYVNSTTTSPDICLSINHPSFGTNYTCGNPINTTINISYFRNSNFSNGVIFNSNSFANGFSVKNVTINSHQYDEADSLTFNISGKNNSFELAIYRANTTPDTSNSSQYVPLIDRYYEGYLNGSKIYLFTLYNPITDLIYDTLNITYTAAGEKLIYFTVDDILQGRTDYTFFLNLTGYLFGFDYTNGNSTTGYEGFDNYTWVDTTQTTANLDISGVVMPKNLTKAMYSYDNFEDGTLDQGRWTNSTCTIGGGSGNDDNCVDETAGQMRMRQVLSDGFEAQSIAYSDLLDRFESDTINFSIIADYNGGDHSSGDSNAVANLSFGGSLIWNLTVIDATGLNFDETADADLDFELMRINRTHWKATIWGTENASTVFGGTFNKVHYGTERIFAVNSNILRYHTWETECGSCTGTNYLYIDYVNESLYTRENSTIYSNSIYDSASNIDFVSGMWFSGRVSNMNDENMTFYLSADNGVNWEEVVTIYNSGTAGYVTDYSIGNYGISNHTFSNPGTNLRFRVDFVFGVENPNSTSQLWKMNISMPSGLPQNITLDFGNDGITDYSFPTGNLSGSTQGNVSYVNISSAFTSTNRYAGLPHTYRIPLSITSATRGTIQISNINLTYDPNPVILNISRIQDLLDSSISFTTFRIPFSASNSTATAATINITDLRYDYAGGNKSYLFTAHSPSFKNNITNSLAYYYSRWEYFFVPNNTEFIEFIPANSIAKNVTPFGQTSTVPILNLTNLGYGGKNTNFSLYVNDTNSCINLTLSTTSNKLNGSQVSNYWTEFKNGTSYLQNSSVWLWADYSCTPQSNWSLFQPYLYFRQCIVGGLCSTALE